MRAGSEAELALRISRTRRGRTVRRAAAAGTAALALGGLFTAFSVPGRRTPGTGPIDAAAPAAGQALSSIGTAAAYTMERQSDGTVKLIMERASGEPDVKGMQAGLDRMGIRGRVYLADPGCKPLTGFTAPDGPRPDADTLRATEENGKQVVYVRPGRMPAGLTLLFTANGTPEAPGTWGIGGVMGPASDCMPVHRLRASAGPANG